MNATMSGFKLDADSSEEDLEAIPAYLRAYRPTRIDKKRKRVHTWRDDRIGFFPAFFQGRMRSNDYVLMWSLIAMIILIIIFGAASGAVTEKAVGIMVAVTVLHAILLAISMLGNIIANRRQEIWERILQLVSFVIFYIPGIAFLFIAYETDLLLKETKDLNEIELKQRSEVRSYLTGELIIIPLVTNFLALATKAYRDNTNGRSMTPGFWILLSVCLVQVIALTACIFIFLDSGAAWGLVFLLIFALYFFAQYVMRVRYSSRPLKITEKVKITGYQQQRVWNVMNIVIGLGVFIATIVYSRSDDTTSDYASQSITFGMVVFMLSFLVLATWISDRTRMKQMPIYHSPWIFPIYKYYPSQNDVEPYNSAVVSFYALSLLIMMWCIVTTVQISPSWLGVALTCGVECAMVIVTLYFMNTNNIRYKKIATHVDTLVIKQAWLDAKENLCKML